MKKIAYIDHSYHKKTRSTDFLAESLKANGHHVVRFWDDSWNGGSDVSFELVKDYDVVIMFMSLAKIQEKYYRHAHPNVIYIPMLDQFGLWLNHFSHLAPFFEPFQGSKVLNFSYSLHCVTQSLGIKSEIFRFYPSAKPLIKERKKGLHGFFWLRRESDISWPTIRSLIENTTFDSFHLHLANDPDTTLNELPDQEEIKKHNITTSTWFDSKDDFLDIQSQANVFFAPRMGEGIGQSFLEAMASAQCVVAPDEGTMNEYILHGVNGLLYDGKNPRALSFENVEFLGISARDSIRKGHEVWRQIQEKLVQYILSESDLFYKKPFPSKEKLNPALKQRVIFNEGFIDVDKKMPFNAYWILRQPSKATKLILRQPFKIFIFVLFNLKFFWSRPSTGCGGPHLKV